MFSRWRNRISPTAAAAPATTTRDVSVSEAVTANATDAASEPAEMKRVTQTVPTNTAAATTTATGARTPRPCRRETRATRDRCGR